MGLNVGTVRSEVTLHTHVVCHRAGVRWKVRRERRPPGWGAGVGLDICAVSPVVALHVHLICGVRLGIERRGRVR